MTKNDALKLALDIDPIHVICRLNGIRLDSHQAEVIESDHRKAVFLWPRQSGKSLCADLIVLDAAIRNPGSHCIVAAPSQRQAALHIRSIRKLIEPIRDVVRLKNESALSIEFVSGSWITSVPSSEQTIRGHSSIAVAVLDEASCFEDDGILHALSPMTATVNGKLILLSTPRQARGWFFDLWDGQNDFHKSQITWRDCPRLTREFIESERLTMPSQIFEREYESTFTDEIIENSVFDPDIFIRNIDPNAEALKL